MRNVLLLALVFTLFSKIRMHTERSDLDTHIMYVYYVHTLFTYVTVCRLQDKGKGIWSCTSQHKRKKAVGYDILCALHVPAFFLHRNTSFCHTLSLIIDHQRRKGFTTQSILRINFSKACVQIQYTFMNELHTCVGVMYIELWIIDKYLHIFYVRFIWILVVLLLH